MMTDIIRNLLRVTTKAIVMTQRQVCHYTDWVVML